MCECSQSAVTLLRIIYCSCDIDLINMIIQNLKECYILENKHRKNLRAVSFYCIFDFLSSTINQKQTFFRILYACSLFNLKNTILMHINFFSYLDLYLLYAVKFFISPKSPMASV